MKIKNFFKTLLAGVAMGISSAIPGVSAGTIAVIFKIYDKLVHAVSFIFKEFKRSITILIPVILGLIIGLIPTIILVHKALGGFIFGLICIFAGFVIGSLPQITNEIKSVKPKAPHVIALVIALIIVIMLGIGSVLIKADVTTLIYDHPVWLYFVMIPVGLISSIALVVPGISGSMVLILIGFYTPLIESTTSIAKECLSGNWSNFLPQFGLLACFLIGILIGFFFVSKLMNYLLNKYKDITFFAILGFVLGSIVALFYNYNINEYYQMWKMGGQGYLSMNNEIIVGVVLLVAATVLSYLLVRYFNKQQKPSDEITTDSSK